MRLANILLLVILFSCTFFQAYALEEGVIAEPSITGANMNMPEPVITKPNMDMSTTNPKTQDTQNSNPNQTQSKTGNLSSNQTQVAQEPQEAEAADVSGKWSIKFSDRRDASLDLTLWSAGRTAIMGFGSLNEGGAMNSVSATGSFSVKELTLIVKSAAPKNSNQRYDECDLDLFMENNTLTGTYVLKSGGQSLGMGNATATKAAAN
jgi:hypothetical protein